MNRETQLALAKLVAAKAEIRRHGVDHYGYVSELVLTPIQLSEALRLGYCRSLDNTPGEYRCIGRVHNLVLERVYEKEDAKARAKAEKNAPPRVSPDAPVAKGPGRGAEQPEEATPSETPDPPRDEPGPSPRRS